MTSVGVMASSIEDAVCTAVLAEPFNNFTDAPWTLNAIPTIVTGRTGTAANVSGATQRAEYNIPAPAQSDTITVGFAWRYTDAVTSLRTICQLWSDSGVSLHNYLRWTKSSGLLEVTRYNATVLGSATFAFTQNTWYYIEFQARLGDSPNGFGIVRVNGTEVLNTGPVDTKQSGTKTVYDQLRIAAALGSGVNQYDDLYLSTGAGCSFLGDHTIP